MSIYLPFILSCEDEEVIETLHPIFMYNGVPTEEYKDFLLELVQYAIEADDQSRARIQHILMRCEEGVYLSITGIIPVQNTDPRYAAYVRVLHAIYDHVPCIHKDKADICNSTVVHLIQALGIGCVHKHCYRTNRLHKQLMHHPLQY